MNRSFVKLTAIALAALALLSAAACGEINPTGGQNADNNTPAGETEVPTAAPTENPTEKPTEVPTPTPEPTATPVPWITDPSGIIPKEVEILVRWDERPGVCIAKVDGKTKFQIWNRDKSGLQKEWEIPEKFAETYNISYFIDKHQKDEFFLLGNIAKSDTSRCVVFYQNNKGKAFYFDCNSVTILSEKILIATTDGKAIWYQWGDDYYKMHDFGPDVYLENTDISFYVDGEGIYIGDIEFQKIPI